jgi:hypothetical protein
MAELSPKAQVVLDAVCNNTEPDCDTQHIIAAALRAAADQVVLMRPHGGRAWTVGQAVTYDALTNAFDLLNAIAAELEGATTPAPQPEPEGDGLFHWRNLGDGKPVQVRECPMCGIAPANVDDCGRFGDPACPYFGVGEPEPEGLTNADGIDEEAATVIPWLLEEAVHAADADQSYAAGKLTLAAQLLGERRPAIEPEPGEVAELVRRLRDWHSIPLLEERERIATLLQQLSALTTTVESTTFCWGEDLNDD